MSLITYVIDDKSPLIKYDSTWFPGTGQENPFVTEYYFGTFTTTNASDGSASFNFNGTQVWIFGGNRPNYGNYIVQLDGATHPGYSAIGNNVFRQTLFTTSLSQGTHTMNLINTGGTNGSYVDIDLIVWKSVVGNANDQLIPEIVQNSDSRFQYQGTWSGGVPTININFGLFNNGTGHLTQTYDASVTFTFTVTEGISLYGTSGPLNGPYSAQLDGGQTMNYDAYTTDSTNYGVMIYHADNLGPGSHQLILTNLPGANPQSALCIDHAQLLTVANLASTGNPLPSSNDVQQNGLSPGAIAGIAIAVAAAVLSAGIALLFYRRWRTAMETQQNHYRTITPCQGILETNTVGSTRFPSSTGAGSNVPVNILQNGASTPGISGGSGYVHCATRDDSIAFEDAPQFDAVIQDHLPSIAPDSCNLVLPGQTAVDEGSAWRPLPEAPGGGMALPGPRRRQNAMSADHESIAISEAPPNYTQAIGNVMAIHD